MVVIQPLSTRSIKPKFLFANSFPFYYFYVMLRRITGQLTLFKYKIDIERTFEALFACFLQFFSFVSCLKYIFLIPRRSNLGIQYCNSLWIKKLKVKNEDVSMFYSRHYRLKYFFSTIIIQVFFSFCTFSLHCAFILFLVFKINYRTISV